MARSHAGSNRGARASHCTFSAGSIVASSQQRSISVANPADAATDLAALRYRTQTLHGTPVQDVGGFHNRTLHLDMSTACVTLKTPQASTQCSLAA